MSSRTVVPEDLVEAVGTTPPAVLTRSSTDNIDIDSTCSSGDEREPRYFVQWRTPARATSPARRGRRVHKTTATRACHGPDRGGTARDARDYPLRSSATLREPHRVARYLEELAGRYHKWYDTCRVRPVNADEEVTDLHRTRLWLNDATSQVLANGLDLLGVSAPERM